MPFAFIAGELALLTPGVDFPRDPATEPKLKAFPVDYLRFLGLFALRSLV